jgi:hypothetical protein
MRATSVVYIVVIVIPLCYMAFLLLLYPELFWETLPEFIATSFGVIMSFGFAQYATFIHEQKQAKQVLSAIKKELQLNLKVLDGIKKVLHGEDLSSPYVLFKTNTWEALNAMLSGVRNYDVVVHLGELYWEIATANEWIKEGGLSDRIFTGTGHSLEQIEEHINDLVHEIDREIGKQQL